MVMSFGYSVLYYSNIYIKLNYKSVRKGIFVPFILVSLIIPVASIPHKDEIPLVALSRSNHIGFSVLNIPYGNLTTIVLEKIF